MDKQSKNGWYVLYCEADNYTTFRRFRYFDAMEKIKGMSYDYLYEMVPVHKEWTHPAYEGTNSVTEQPGGWYVLCCEADDYIGFNRYRYLDAIEHEKLLGCNHPHTVVRVHKQWTHPKYKGENR